MTGHKYMTFEPGSSVYKPLYPPEGGPLGGFLCCQCKAVTRTKKGMLTHLATVHGLRMQHELPFEETTTANDLLPELPVKTDEQVG